MTSTSDLAEHFLRACEDAAIAAARWRGLGERKKADGAAVVAHGLAELYQIGRDRLGFVREVAIGFGVNEGGFDVEGGQEIGQ